MKIERSIKIEANDERKSKERNHECRKGGKQAKGRESVVMKPEKERQNWGGREGEGEEREEREWTGANYFSGLDGLLCL